MTPGRIWRRTATERNGRLIPLPDDWSLWDAASGLAIARIHAEPEDGGWAMAYLRYSSDYIGAERVAKNAKRGIWVGIVQPPWEWRHEKRNHYSSTPSP